MINKFKYLFLLVLCIGTIGGLTEVSAQSGGDQVLVTGKKPLRQSEIDKLIEFYEWAFEARFTDEQRRKFRDYTIIEYRNDVNGSRKTMDDISQTFAKILAAEESVQSTTRKAFLEVFLPESRNNSDENSRMLLEIYETAHNNGAGGSDVSNNGSDNSTTDVEFSNGASGGNISALAGKWAWGRSGSSTHTTGGAYVGSNGSRFTYQFSANGAVEFTGIMNIMTSGCKLQAFTLKRGKAKLSGNTLTINWAPASFTRDDSCSPSKNYKKTLPAETETLQVNLKDSYGQKQLCLTGKDETCFSPTN